MGQATLYSVDEFERTDRDDRRDGGGSGVGTVDMRVDDFETLRDYMRSHDAEVVEPEALETLARIEARIKELEDENRRAYLGLIAENDRLKRVVEAARVLDDNLSSLLDECWNGDAEDCNASCEPCAIRYFRAALADYDKEAR